VESEGVEGTVGGEIAAVEPEAKANVDEGTCADEGAESGAESADNGAHQDEFRGARYGCSDGLVKHERWRG
jgi:hypothetical protein